MKRAKRLPVGNAPTLGVEVGNRAILHVYLTGDIPKQSFTLEYALAAELGVAVNGSISSL
jgi:hypothetical protein